MTVFGKVLGVGGLLLLAATAIHTTPAYAVSKTVDLTTWDDPYLDASTEKVTVTISYAGAGKNATTTVTFKWDEENSGLNGVAWNSKAKVLDCADGWTCGGKGENGEFGLFKRTASTDQDNQDDHEATFVLKGKVYFGGGGKGRAQFAALVNYDGCSAYVSNAGAQFGGKHAHGCTGVAEASQKLPENGGGVNVPEPASVMLLGASLAGIGIWRRRFASQ